MSYLQTVKQQAELLLTYLLTLVDGSQHWLVPVDAINGVVMAAPNDRGIMRGNLHDGGNIDVAISDIFMVEEKPYRVTTFTGQTTRSEKCSERRVEEIIERNTNKDTGEVKHISGIQDTRDEDNGVDRHRKRL